MCMSQNFTHTRKAEGFTDTRAICELKIKIYQKLFRGKTKKKEENS